MIGKFKMEWSMEILLTSSAIHIIEEVVGVEVEVGAIVERRAGELVGVG